MKGFTRVSPVSSKVSSKTSQMTKMELWTYLKAETCSRLSALLRCCRHTGGLEEHGEQSRWVEKMAEGQVKYEWIYFQVAEYE